ncbi:MAG: glycosyltransferase [Candidatus Dojkabacteria bacterium]
MKIAIISSNTLPTPPAGVEIPDGWTTSIHNLISEITEGLVNKGHDVTLYASGDSKTSAKLKSVWDVSSSELEKIENQFGYYCYDHILTSYCFEDLKKEKYDIIYTYHTFDSGIYGNLIEAPIVSTFHGSARDDYLKIWGTKIISPNIYIGISDFQINSIPYLHFYDRIYHGIDGDFFKYQSHVNDNLVTVGRISTDKGTDISIDIANELNKQLDIFGTTNYKPLMDELLEKSKDHKINFHGQKEQNIIKHTVSNSKAFIFPIRWDEPFGLVLIESLACGTPIIAFANGSLPEIVEDGKTGFLVNSDESNIRGDWITKKTGREGLLEAVNKLYSLPMEEYLQMRKNCRESFEQRFTKEIMINNYEKLFQKIISEKIEK